jgi:signal peptidase II
MARRYKIFLAVASIVILLDQGSKWMARSWVSVKPHTVLHDGQHVDYWSTVRGPWSWDLSFNQRAAFGLSFFKENHEANRWLLTSIGVLACVAIFLILRKAKDWQRWMTIALASVAGGALGNVIDRVTDSRGVTDFVVWHWYEHKWPTFNVADAALVGGVLILFLDIGREQKRAKQEKQAAEKAKEVRPGKDKSKAE